MQKFLLFSSFTPLVVFTSTSIICDWLEQENGKSQRKQVAGWLGSRQNFMSALLFFLRS